MRYATKTREERLRYDRADAHSATFRVRTNSLKVMLFSSRGTVLSFAAGALLALVMFRIVPATLLRVACSGACAPGVASTRPTTRLSRNDAARGTSSARRDLGPGLYVMLAPEAPPTSDDRVVATRAPAGANAGDTSVAVAGTPPQGVAPPSPPPGLDVASPGTAVGSLDGWWLVTNAIESSDRRKPTGLFVVYRINLQQDGEHVSGKGSTWSKNGRMLRPSQQTPIVATGTRRGNRVELVLTEHATRGTRQGRVELRPTADGEAFEGRFASESAHTSGRSEAVRELNAPVEEPSTESRRHRRHARGRGR